MKIPRFDKVLGFMKKCRFISTTEDKNIKLVFDLTPKTTSLQISGSVHPDQ